MSRGERNVRLNKVQAREIARYEKTFMDYCEDPEDELHVTFEEPYQYILEDLAEAVANIRKKNPTVEEFGENWFYPIETLADSFGLEKAAGLTGEQADDKTGVRGLLVSDEEIFANTWFRMAAIWEESDDAARVADTEEFSALEAQINDYLVLREVPVLDREFPPDVMEEYIGRFLSDVYRRGANEKEIAVAVKFTDMLCRDDCVTALRLKGYSCYGGNELYACDWKESERCLSRLLDLTGDPEYANTLGYIAYYGRTDGTPDYEKAFRMYSLASACGYFEATYKLGDMFRTGRGCRKSEIAARSLYGRVYSDCLEGPERTGETANLADAALRMCLVYKDGIDTFPDAEAAYKFALEAVKYARLRAQQDDFFGNTKVLLGALRARSEIRKKLPRDFFSEYTATESPDQIGQLLSGGHRAELRVTPLGLHQYRIRAERIPNTPLGEPDRFLLTVPALDYCELVSKTEMTAVEVEEMPRGRKFTADGVRYDAHTRQVSFFCLGKEVLSFRCSGFRFYGNGSPAERKGNPLQFATVVPENGGEACDCFCGALRVKEGDRVAVIYGSGEKEGRVTGIFFVYEEDLGIPADRFQKVVRKI